MTRSFVRYAVLIAVAVIAGVGAQYAPPPFAEPLRLLAVLVALAALWDVATSRSLQTSVWIERKGLRDELVWIDGDWRLVR